MNKIELVQSLIDQVNILQYRNGEELDFLRKRAEMITRNVFGESSKYLKDLNNIRFYPMGLTGSEDDSERSWLSGKSQMLNLFNTMLEEFKLSGLYENDNTAQEGRVEYSNEVFIVHGHDEAMKQSVARIIEKMGLDPIILHEKPSGGKTIIEKFTDYSNVSFAIILLSPDDIAYPKAKSPEDAKLRARQNVIFELGFFIGKLGRNRVIALYQEENDFEMPSDYSGVLYTLYDNSGRWQFDLVRELKACGYNVDANELL